MKDDPKSIVRKSYQAYVDKDRVAIEAVLSNPISRSYKSKSAQPANRKDVPVVASVGALKDALGLLSSAHFGRVSF